MQTIILIGDSIRYYYEQPVREELSGIAEVWGENGDPCNSRNVLAHLEEWVLSRPPDVVHINCGLHDLKRESRHAPVAVGLEEYEQNIRLILGTIRSKTHATVVWASTTPVNEQSHHRLRGVVNRLEADVARYNDAATRVIRELGIPFNDLCGVVERTGRDKLLQIDGVHFTPDGYDLLSKKVVEAIKPYLRIEELTYPIRWDLFPVCARGTWNPALTSAEIMREACGKLYGEAGDSMFRFYRTFKEAAVRSTANGIDSNLSSPHELYTPQVEAEATRCLEDAAAVATSEPSRMRVAEEKWMWSRVKPLLVQLREAGTENTVVVMLDGRPRNYSRPKITANSVRWLHGLPRDTLLFVIEPDGRRRPFQNNEMLALSSGVHFSTK